MTSSTPLCIYSVKLRLVLLNTIGNAAKAVLPGSVLTASGNSQMNGQGTIWARISW